MVVGSVSPTPFALLRRAKNFEYRDDDRVLQAFSNYDDPVQALSYECRRVLKSISSINESNASTTNALTSLGDASWSRFEDLGFGSLGEYNDEPVSRPKHAPKSTDALNSAPQTKTNNSGRPTTPSWADFLSSGFVDEQSSPAPRPLLLPPDKILPPIDLDSKRGQSSQSHAKKTDDQNLEPGELASINALELDDAFWWVWITSLAGEETVERKAVFGRCALIETVIGGAWLVIEEMVKGAAPEPEVGAYIAEKKGRFTFGKRKNISQNKIMGKKTQIPNIEPFARNSQSSPASKTSIGPDQHARIQAAAAVLQEKQKQQEIYSTTTNPRRARGGDAVSTKTNSVFTLQPVIMSEAAPAMKWANSYDKRAVRATYLGDELAGKGSSTQLRGSGLATNGSATPQPPAPISKDTPPRDYGFPKEGPKAESIPLPAETPSERVLVPADPPHSMPAAPLPAEPKAQPASRVAAAAVAAAAVAAEVPLPAPDGEPLEQIETLTDQQGNELSPQTSPEAKRTGNKLRKKDGRNFKGLFKKKTAPLPQSTGPADPLAAAAARAALSSKSQQQGSHSLTRRLSRIGRKDHPMAAAKPPMSMPEGHEDEQLKPPAPIKDEYDSQVSLSRVDSKEQREAERQFPKFDEGPLDQPAFAPGNSPRPSYVPESAGVSRPSTAEPVGAHYDPPITKGGAYQPSISSAETEEQTKPNGAEDRWAQIRRNAAERAGRFGDDQVTPGRKSADSAGEGDESGEESKCVVFNETVPRADLLLAIESRVARIKQRVAELTGNMQAQEAGKA